MKSKMHLVEQVQNISVTAADVSDRHIYHIHTAKKPMKRVDGHDFPNSPT